MSVCLCLSTHICLKPLVKISPNFLYVLGLPVAVVPSSSDGNDYSTLLLMLLCFAEDVMYFQFCG